MNILSHTNSFRALSLTLMALMLTLATPPAEAQTAGKISIGGKVYGGGKEGAILSGNTTSDNSTAIEIVEITDKNFRTSATAQASQVTINNGNIVGVFGGGEEGRAYGKTNVTVKDGVIGVTAQADINKLDEATQKVNGNVFGAGDGNAAAVFGGSDVTIIGGTINGSVYGGGNEADLIGCSELDLQGGVYVGAVFGGARKSNIYGYTFVNIDGLNAKNDLHIIDVYGGNDIAGTIQPDERWSWTKQSFLQVPFALAGSSGQEAKAAHLTSKPSDNVDNTWNAFILATEDNSPNKFKTLVDNLYGGGNGDYDYSDAKYSGLHKPEIERTYMQLEGGAYGNVYGGGNAATVTESTDICLYNASTVNADYLASLTGTKSEKLYTADYQFNRVFGGNNKEPMAIRPNWYLEKATVNNLYSGGNAGPMTYFHQTSTGGAQSLAGDAGILVHVKSNDMTINNVYGGCRMADVDPNGHKGADMTLNAETIDGYDFPRGYAARVLIEGGDINNVYGGNDVSGNVYYGSLVEIHSSINGNVYGAGNGSYAYTDNANLKGDKEYGDYYYEASGTGLASAQALSKHRPNAAQSYVHVTGTESKPTYIGGAIYCGGNSATLRALGDDATALKNAKSELHIGSYVIADQVFLGSNGENMVKSDLPTDLLQIYKKGPVGYSAYATANSISGNYSSMDLTVSEQFEEYMSGVEVAIKPEVTFDADYVSHSTKFGSLYCGGNVGSMSADGYFDVKFLQKLVIYNKLVGGCNNANVAKTDYNAFHLGGLTGAPDANNNKVLLTVAGLLLEPRVLTGNVKSGGFNLNAWNIENGMLKGANIYGGCYSSGYINGGVNIDIQQNAISPNVFADAPTGSGITYDEIRDDVLASTLACYGGGYGKETEIWGNVTVSITGDGQIMKAYGGGEMGVVGKLDRDADGKFLTTTVEEWYPTTETKEYDCDDVLDQYKSIEISTYTSKPHTVAQFATNYNTTVNLNANLPAGTTNNVAKLYAGGFQGTVSGNTTANLNRGRAYDAFGGASNADILGHAETYIGKASAPTITHNVYGANDFGGLIVGTKRFDVDNVNNEMEQVVAQTYVEYSAGHIGDGSNLAETDANYLEGGNIFGGPCGAYEYTDPKYAGVIQHYTLTEYNAANSTSLTEEQFNKLPEALRTKPGFCKPMLLKNILTPGMLVQHGGAGYGANSFVNIISNSAISTDYIEGAIFGAGQGKKGRINSADEQGSYVRLASATTSQRTVGALSRRVYGAGYCSNTNRSLVDAYTGYFGTIFGAAHGISYEEVLDIVDHNGTYETNYMGYRSAVRLHEMVNNQMDIYGGGANAGAQESGVVLNGGQAHDVYGASYDQGITYAATVDVPAGSTSRVNNIFGGARGKSDEFPCDAFNTFVTWRSAGARVNNAIYGGNNNARMTRNAYISINQPVKNSEDKLTNVFGGGYGENTVTLYTEVGLHDGAQVANAYGGGNNGQVLDTPSFRYYLDDGKKACADGVIKPEADGRKTYPKELLGTGYGYEKYLRDTEVIGFHEWIMRYNWTGCRIDNRKQPLGSYLANDHGQAHDLYFLSTQMDNVKNTHVIIETGATVAENVYGGGYGAKATVSGETSVQLLGGTVVGDIYGGGYGGHVEEYPHLIYPSTGDHELTMSATNVDLGSGSARNVYGGGLNGNVTGSTNVIVGSKDMGLGDFAGTLYDGTGGTVAIPRVKNKDYQGTAIFCDGYLYAGDPIVERSLYGGGQNGHVKGTAYLTINQGHVGYKYDRSVTIETTTNSELKAEYNDTKTTAARKEEILKEICYVDNLDLNDPGDNYLDQNGNAFGAGYGEGAYVDQTYVNMYGGTIRNSLYGGGEIAAVGEATMTQTGAHPQVGTISVPGRTHIYMYNGLVQGDVFGGGRGYSYDLTGNEVIGKTLYTDGYVFGTTEVDIRGGVVGTPKTVADGHGNVFGGGNIGYCFTDAVKHGTKGDNVGEGRYYTNAWKCDMCGYIDYCHNKPIVCGKCGKSTTATDTHFQTDFTQVNAQGTTAGVTNEAILSEDCRVVISPWAQVIADGGIDIKGNGTTLPDGSVLTDKHFDKGDYVPTEYLNLLKDKNTDAAQWAKLSNDGVIVRNAVFAGGNVSSGSDKVYANAITVFGNATASVNDIFFRDLITIGTEHTGGIYGDGNLTFVDGYRELNITNYGTDYYSQQDHITLDEYNAMNDRERAYFELEYQTTTGHKYEYYTCKEDHEYNDVRYSRNQHITKAVYDTFSVEEQSKWSSGSVQYADNARIKQSEWEKMTSEEQAAWKQFGFCSIYAGRLLNSIQRADFCGVFGSRLVLQGAQDRVPEVVDYTQYTINRVGELSLNKKVYEGTNTDGLDDDKITHGNYFGMYNIVNYLGALTSDVRFDAVRTTDNTNAGYKDPVDGKDYGTATFYDWKKAHQSDRKRNNGTCHNTVALAAGVYLEIVEEPATSTPTAEKEYGYITGIIQLDLINVMPGLGGGYVYAKNEHGARSNATLGTGLHENLSVYNKNAVNNTAFNYDESNRELIETSGNFIHNVKQIVDDCYPAGGRYDDYNAAPAHYWYIRGEIYVYDQYISAYTGSSTAYQENINLPLTITAGANGRLDLIDIKQNMYAYYKEGTTPLGASDAIVVNNITYGLNDVITYWEYMQLSDSQKAHFVPETYVAAMDYATSDGGARIEKGEVILPTRYAEIKNTVAYDPDDITETVPGEPHMKQITMGEVFHVSNAVSHENGYVLAVSLDNPMAWDRWYSPTTGPKKINQKEYSEKSEGDKSGYVVGPTYYPTTAGVYGQHQYVLDDIVTNTVKTAYDNIPDKSSLAGQATVAPAYVAIAAAEYEYNTLHKNVQAGVGISADEYSSLNEENKAKFSPAYQCTSTFEEDAASGLYIYYGELIPATKYQDLKAALVEKYTADPNIGASKAAAAAEQTMFEHFDNAYIVTSAGLYGGQYFGKDYNYGALYSWATLSKEDRTNFKFRHDALDALYLSSYPGTGEEGPGSNNIQLYDGPYWGWTGDKDSDTPQHQVYGAKQPIDYTATYHGTTSNTYLTPGKEYTRDAYEALPNERRHYSPFEVKAEDVGKTFYIVKESFISGGTAYAAGRVITQEVYNSFDDGRKAKVITYAPTAQGTYYICREGYKVNEKGEGYDVRDIRSGGATYTTGNDVPTGIIINGENYGHLVNLQLDGFTIHGNSPIETSTFYVNRESDIYDLSKDRIVTVIYQYKYEESDESGNNVEEITERHIINIHITFKSGVPTIGKLQDPSIVLPGQTVGLKQPNVTPGAYEILGGGWELFTNPEDAEKHTNGKTYVNNATPMYWYQDGYYVAYYAKTYLGKTYSNSVPFKVANYHDIADVMADNENYMFIDHPHVKRNSKIYISNDVVENLTVTHKDAVDEHNAPLTPVKRTESEIDMLYSLFQNSLASSKKRIYVDVQDTDANGPLYYQVNDDGSKNTTLPPTNEITAYPVTHKEPRYVPVLDDHVRNCANLAFYLSENVSSAKDGGWVPIGTYDDGNPSTENNGQCFMGRLHGMGYTINKLENSLFENLCGYVYNLGVTGSFWKSGVADRVSTGTLPDSDPEQKVHGHVNSSWIYTSAEPDEVRTATGNPAKPYYPVVGTPNDLSAGRDGDGNVVDMLAAVNGMHTLNCYYPEGSGYPEARTPGETANSASLRQFNNGEVAYDLNGFYLNKRYSDACVTGVPDGTTSPTTGDNAIYQFWKQQSDGTLESTPTTGYYLGGGSMHAYDGKNLGYVERLFADGDFVYQHGTIPLETNERYSTTESRYLPIWPDDYYFFGQQLTYGYDETDRPYQPLPDHVRKTISADGSGKDNRLVTTEQNNVVYRIPAYFRSSLKQMAHFNPYAVFADKMKEGYTLGAADVARGLDDDVLDGKEVHPGLTALDFTGFNDRAIMADAGTDHQKFENVVTNHANLVFTNGSRNISGKSGYEAKYKPLDDNAYFGPITDYTTIMSFETHGITQNLLAYAPTASWSGGTANTQKVLHDYFNEPVYADHYSADKYRKVDALDESTISGVHGHLVFKENTKNDRHYYYAVSDQFLVDLQDFNAPIEYEFNSASTVDNKEYRMWYQRAPDNYAGVDNEGKAIGWEGVSLPFAAELVTTQQKGEITHFYQKQGGGFNDGYDTGHEYWLREFTGVQDVNKTDPDRTVTTALMNYPVELTGPSSKVVTNTFLWDYYYNADGKDANNDDYRHEYDGEHTGDEQDRTRYYYGKSRTYQNYPLSVPGKPYIAGFPGDRYYEFDLSGKFVPEHSGTTTPAKLKAPQTVSFVSDNGITIRVSDVELADGNAGMITPDGSDYTFYGNYLNVEAPAPDEMDRDYTWEEYNTEKGTSLTEEQFNALPDADKHKDHIFFKYYVLNGDGSAFDLAEAPEKTPIAPFRPYFATKVASQLQGPKARRIVFSRGGDTQFEPEIEPEDQTIDENLNHGLYIYAKKGKIIVESTLTADRRITILGVDGALHSTFTIAPGEKIETKVNHAGVYIVNRKKLMVR